MQTGMSSKNNIFKLRRTIETRAHLESLAREQTEAALNVSIQVMEKTRDERTRLMAARMLRDRGWVSWYRGPKCGKAED
jgi:hypothetical protein